MKVFISWSGQQSHKVATVLRDWLPSVIQSILPYVSSEDIDKGARWTTDIAGELNQSTYGILCVTRENVEAPWLNFEAGALGKSVDKSRVSPFLFRLKRSEVEGPILQFQSTVFEKDDVYKLLKSLNQSCEGSAISDGRLERAFDVWWPALQKDLESIPQDAPSSEPEKKSTHTIASISKILEEVLELSRNNQKLLRSPEELFPPAYIERFVTRPLGREFSEALPSEHPAWLHMVSAFNRLQIFIRNAPPELKDSPFLVELNERVSELKGPIGYLVNRGNSRRGSKRLGEELL